MCTDCGCSIRGKELGGQGVLEEAGEHSHDGGKTFHSHADEGHSHEHDGSGEHQKAHEHLHHNPQLN
ncbi:MAG: hydrogenase accessory protein HypB, partial [Sulfurovum sp.]|nr:hydrogenase accessory protein HypB [Sulfurovum sp.]